MKMNMRFVGGNKGSREGVCRLTRDLGIVFEHSPAYRYTLTREDREAAESLPEEIALALNSGILPYFDVEVEVDEKRFREGRLQCPVKA